MREHIHHHKNLMRKKRRKFFPLLFLAMLLLGAFVVLYKKYGNVFTSTPIVSTTTPTIKPTPKPPPLPPSSSPVGKTPTELSEPYITIRPEKVLPGEPALIIVTGLLSTSSVKSFTFDNRPLVIFQHEGEVVALLGVDLQAKAGAFPLVVTLNNGKKIFGTMEIQPRPLVARPFDIPEKLGGNSLESQKELISSLAKEGKMINALPTVYKKLWTEKFVSPLKKKIVIEDPYGYTRIFSNSSMPHKGTDFEAKMGTSIYSMNRGTVVYTGDLRNYGKTIVIDHGFGLQTVYMHLSSTSVIVGKEVEKGEFIGLTGDTGYVLGPHLHLTVRIWDISIDPVKFLELFG